MKSARKAAAFPRNGLNSWIIHGYGLTGLTCHGPCYALVCIGRNGMWKGAVCERKHGLIRSSPEKLDGLHSLHWVMLETIDIY